MLFNSFEFVLVFLPASFLIYFRLNHLGSRQPGKLSLVLASAGFYAWWNYLYLPLIVASLTVNYCIGHALASGLGPAFRKRLLVIGVALNLSALGYFKYADFFIQNVNSLAGTQWPLLHLALPLAISFYTFQQVAYIVDCYQGKVPKCSFLDYSVFVLFFPQLIAGPIVHHSEMMPQFADDRRKMIDHRNTSAGLMLFSIGLFKKVVVADTFAVWATNGFDVAPTLNILEAWVTSLSYTMQLYFDFSGYSDMAIGIGLLFNIRLPTNFFSPYKSTSIREFWRRWHMTLSRFLKDYVYIPLGGNQRGRYRTYCNLMATFFLGGLWHGAGWTFIFWGLLHGAALAVHRYWSGRGLRLPGFLAWFITFNFVNIAWVFFRAQDFSAAEKVLKSMLGLGSSVPVASWEELDMTNVLAGTGIDSLGLIYLPLALGACVFARNSMQRMDEFRPSAANAAATVFLLVISFFSLNKYSEFLYFQF